MKYALQMYMFARYHDLLYKALTHISLASFLLDIGKQNSPRFNAAERGVPSGGILFADMIFIKKGNKIEKGHLMSLK